MKPYQYLIIGFFVLSLVSCNRTSKENIKFYNDSNVEQVITIKRFDKALFAKPKTTLQAHLASLEKQYPDMFQMPLSDKEYMQMILSFVSDKQMQKAQNIIETEFSDLDFLSKDLTSAFARLKQIYPSTTLPNNVYTLILGSTDYSYGYENRVYMNDTSYFAIALDVYSINQLSKHPYYKQYPQYMRESLGKQFIAPDFIKMYLLNHTFLTMPLPGLSGEGSLLDCIVEDGKFSYLVQQLLPKYSLATILRYSDKQIEWLQKNEANIWAYMIQGNLLYEKDRSKYLSFIAEGPETKGLHGSPARAGNYIGYKIVESYMKENKISLDSLMKSNDSYIILQQSKYKPHK